MFEIPAPAVGRGSRLNATALAASLQALAIAAVLLLSPVRKVWHTPPHVTLYGPEPHLPGPARPVKAGPLAPDPALSREAGPAMPEAPLAQARAPQGEVMAGGFDISAGEIVSARGFGGNGRVASGGFDDVAGVSRGFLPGGGSASDDVFEGLAGAGRGTPAPSAQLELDEPAELLPGPSPEYTAEAKRSGVMGEILLEVELRSSGEVHVVRVLSPRLGCGLDDAAVRAANLYRCRPARKRGRAVTILGKIRITFTLSA